MMDIETLDTYISKYIQGGFWANDMRVLKEEIEKLKPGDVYVEIGVDEGRSARTAHEYAHPDVYKIYIDIHNVDHHEKSIGRGRWMEQEGMVGISKKGFFVHGDADEFSGLFGFQCVSLLFIDGHHGYEDVKRNYDMWIGKVKKGSTILFHDTDHEGVLRFLNEYYGSNWENLHGKVGRVKK